MTLLLTGRAQSDWKNCSSEELGIGLLTNSVGEVSQAMARPKRPVWLLRGETCFSVLTVESYWRCGAANTKWSSGEDIKTISKVDKPGVPLSLLHWNGWYGQHGKTRMRLIASEQTQEMIPLKKRLCALAKQSSFSGVGQRQGTVSLLMERRRQENLVSTISTKEHQSNQTKQQENPIRPIELDRIKIFEQDRKLYPKNHKMWRFDMGTTKDDDDAGEDRELPASDDDNWIPYYRLTPRQKLLVETNLGPKIKTILWTRWPSAVIDYFAPDKGRFPVV